MTQERDQYAPRFPQAHALLLETYQHAMKSEGQESVVWCERFKALVRGWEALKTEGVLPGLFLKHFWEDVRDVMGRVHAELDRKELSEKQQLLTFAIANLHSSFGAPG